MATITSASTIAQIRAAYLDGLSYETDNSVAKCKQFIEACRAILAFPMRAAMGQTGAPPTEYQFDLARVREELVEAQNWLGANSTGRAGSVTHVDFTDFRV